MKETSPVAQPLTFEQLATLRRKTEAIAQFLRDQLQAHLETLRPLFAPRRFLGKFVAGKEEVPGAEKAVAQLQTQFQEVCGKPFALPAEFDTGLLSDIDNRLVLFPWEYTYDATYQNETKTLTMTSPVRWVLTYSSGYTLEQLRHVLADQHQSRPDYVRQFIVNALVMRLCLEKFPGLVQLFADLRYQIRTEKVSGFGDLPLLTITSCVSSFRPADELILMATRFSGVPAFIELVDVDSVPALEDPLKERIEQLLRS
jgi:hypothetical protein